MYFDWRLFGLTRGVRLWILFAAGLGLIAVGAGVARLAVSGVIIYRVLAGQASFSALALPLSIIAALIVVRSLFSTGRTRSVITRRTSSRSSCAVMSTSMPSSWARDTSTGIGPATWSSRWSKA